MPVYVTRRYSSTSSVHAATPEEGAEAILTALRDAGATELHHFHDKALTLAAKVHEGLYPTPLKVCVEATHTGRHTVFSRADVWFYEPDDEQPTRIDLLDGEPA
jgi:hypothetical protein